MGAQQKIGGKHRNLEIYLFRTLLVQWRDLLITAQQLFEGPLPSLSTRSKSNDCIPNPSPLIRPHQLPRCLWAPIFGAGLTLQLASVGFCNSESLALSSYVQLSFLIALLHLGCDFRQLQDSSKLSLLLSPILLFSILAGLLGGESQERELSQVLFNLSNTFPLGILSSSL